MIDFFCIYICIYKNIIYIIVCLVWIIHIFCYRNHCYLDVKFSFWKSKLSETLIWKTKVYQNKKKEHIKYYYFKIYLCVYVLDESQSWYKIYRAQKLIHCGRWEWQGSYNRLSNICGCFAGSVPDSTKWKNDTTNAMI